MKTPTAARLARIAALTPAEVDCFNRTYPDQDWRAALAVAAHRDFEAQLRAARSVVLAANELALRLRMATAPKGGLAQQRSLQRGRPSAKRLLAEARRGREGTPARQHVILQAVEGWAVYNAATGGRESGFWPSARGKILEDFPAVDVGVTPNSFFAGRAARKGPPRGSGLFLGPGGSILCVRHIPLPEDRRPGDRWRELSKEQVARREAKSGERLLCEEWERH